MLDESNIKSGWRAVLPVSLRVFGVLTVSTIAILLAIYWIFIKIDYVPLFSQLSEVDASSIARRLDEENIKYKLANGGTTILVPSEQADQAKLDLAATDLQLNGQVGFEIFNESDMGLTEFAQKINYQRALQGELSRTIMSLDGIAKARVHLAVPERTLFRGPQNRPTAAVTLEPTPNAALTADRIAGIQQLVAAAVPDLDPNAVAVLDHGGRLVSTEIASNGDMGGETQAIVQYYRARISSVIAAELPDTPYRLQVAVRQRVSIPLSADAAEAAPVSPDPAVVQDNGQPAGANGARNYSLRIEMTTATPFAEVVRDRLSQKIAEAAGLSAASEDQLVFAVGAVRPAGSGVPATSPNNWTNPTPPEAMASAMQTSNFSWWILGLIISAMVGALIVWFFMRSPQSGPGGVDAESFANQLRARLAVADNANA